MIEWKPKYNNQFLITFQPPHLLLSQTRLCRNSENAMFVILNEVKNLMESTGWIEEILRLTPQNDIVIYPQRGRQSLAKYRKSV
jgi:hypothetical protein